jgi:hypothetical protein
MRLTASLFVLGSFALACSSASRGTAKQADGSYHLQCKGPLTECLQRAERLCRAQGYAVASARDVHELLGHESGESQIEIRKSEAIVFCGSDVPPSERPVVELRREQPVHEDANPLATPPTAAAPAAPAVTAAPARACVPGATQACVGPGGCNGGQACADDGARFEPCNCGSGG